MTFRTVPIVRFKGLLVASIQTELTDQLVLALRDDLSNELARSSPDGVIIELSGIDVVDTFIASAISELGQVAKLMGVDTTVAGLDPGMAITLVEMGMTLPGVKTALNLDAAVEELTRSAAEEDDEDARLMQRLLHTEFAEKR